MFWLISTKISIDFHKVLVLSPTKSRAMVFLFFIHSTTCSNLFCLNSIVIDCLFCFCCCDHHACFLIMRLDHVLVDLYPIECLLVTRDEPQSLFRCQGLGVAGVTGPMWCHISLLSTVTWRHQQKHHYQNISWTVPPDKCNILKSLARYVRDILIINTNITLRKIW